MADSESKRGVDEQGVEDLKAQFNAKLEGLSERLAATPTAQLGGPPLFWDVIALGPFQVPALQPSRIIDVGETAAILALVFLNPAVPSPLRGQNACDIITGLAGTIELNFFTSNTQTMTSVPALSLTTDIPTVLSVPPTCLYTFVWTFTPQAPACLYETNICARVKNCNNVYVPQYSAFARWVYDFDFDLIFGGAAAPGWTFDHSIRFMVT